MVEAWICVLDACNFQRFSWYLGNGHHETQLNEKLKALEFKWIVTHYSNWNNRSRDNIIFGAAGQIFSPQWRSFSLKFTWNLVPLHNFVAFEFYSKIIGASILNLSLYGRSPGGFNEIKNSTGEVEIQLRESQCFSNYVREFSHVWAMTG